MLEWPVWWNTFITKIQFLYYYCSGFSFSISLVEGMAIIFWHNIFQYFEGKCIALKSAMIPEMYLILFMLVFNSLPGMINGTMDKFLPLTVLELNPSIFQNSSNNKMFRWWVFWVTLIDSMWQSAVQYFIPYFTYAITSESYLGGPLETGSTISFYCFGTIVANGSLFRWVISWK